MLSSLDNVQVSLGAALTTTRARGWRNLRLQSDLWMRDLCDLCSAGAVALKLLAGQDKPAAMDVDEEENMSE